VYLGACCWVEPLLTEFIKPFELAEEVRRELWRISAGEFELTEISAEIVAPQLGDTAAILMHDPDDTEMPFSHSAALAAAWQTRFFFRRPTSATEDPSRAQYNRAHA
jgi:hypothetical protein